MDAAISGIMIVIMLGVYLVAFLFSVAMYVLNGIGMMKLAKSCGLRHAWMAFVPFASTYQLGQVAECATKPGKKKLPLRHFALIGQILLVVSAVGYYVWLLLRMFTLELSGEAITSFDLFTILGSAAGSTALLTVISFAVSVLIYYLYWKIYRLFIPQYALIFLLLTIFLGLQPILLFAIRNRAPQFPKAEQNDTWQ